VFQIGQDVTLKWLVDAKTYPTISVTLWNGLGQYYVPLFTGIENNGSVPWIVYDPEAPAGDSYYFEIGQGRRGPYLPSQSAPCREHVLLPD
jgi:hypothetical protein